MPDWRSSRTKEPLVASNVFVRHITGMIAMATTPVVSIIAGLVAYFALGTAWWVAILVAVVVGAVLGVIVFTAMGMNMMSAVKNPDKLLDGFDSPSSRRFPRR